MADTRDMYMAHAALRREFRLLPDLIRSVTPGDTRRAEVVGAHAALVCDVLHGHHEGEDCCCGQARGARGAEAAAIVPTMEQQHHAIEAGTTRSTGLLAAGARPDEGGEELAEAFEQLTTVLVEHMALEEKEILPLADEVRHRGGVAPARRARHGGHPEEAVCRSSSEWRCTRATRRSSRRSWRTPRCRSG